MQRRRPDDMYDISPALRQAVASAQRLIPSDEVLDAIGTLHRNWEAITRVQALAETLPAAGVLRTITDVRRLQRILLRLQDDGDRLERMLLSIEWPPPSELPAHLLKEVTAAYENEQISADQVEALLVRSYDEDLLNELLARWERNGHLTHRLHILREAIRAHVEGRYVLSVPTLIPQIEGVIAEVFAHRGKITSQHVMRYVNVAFGSGSHFDRAGAEFFLRVLLGSFQWGDPIPRFSRHAIVHGADVNYATAANSLRAILILDQLQKSVGYVRSASGRSFHLVTCRTLKGKNNKLRRSYSTPCQAESDGLEPCRHCLPHLVPSR
jgi:hypothetical protein